MKDIDGQNPSAPSDPISAWRLHAIFFFFCAGFVYVAFGLGYRQLFQSVDLTSQSDNQSRRVVIQPSSRGKIFDRNGYVLVDNRVRWSVKADLLALQPEFRKEYLELLKQEKARVPDRRPDYDQLQQTARLNVLNAWLTKIWFVIDSTNQKVKKGAAKVKSTPDLHPEERMVHPDALKKHLTERRALKFPLILDLAFLNSGHAVTPEEGNRAVARFIEQFPVHGPITLEADMVRSYPNGKLASHVLGYVRDSDVLKGQLDDVVDDEFVNLQKLGYSGKKGADGIEATYNEVLSGHCGWQLWTKTSSGYNKDLLRFDAPKQGSDVGLSLDTKIQKSAEDALAKIVDSQGKPLPAAAVMLDVNTGEILALASQPSFNPNEMADRVTQAYFHQVNSEGGWLNRATQGLYAPGSTFKLITATAGMRAGKIDWDDILDCGPSYLVGGRAFPEHEPSGYGQVDLEKMLAVSCNVWNYQVGLKTGPENLAKEARRFGLDAPLLQKPAEHDNHSTTELPNPATHMVVPDRAYKQRVTGQPWTDGDTANTSIGQGYLLTTPLHMACVAASIARGETRTTPTIIHDPGRDGRHAGAEPIGLTTPQLQALREGMLRCVEEGTAKSVRIPGLPYAAKTGTSEYIKNSEKAHLAWIVGYAPADNPVVAFCVLVEGQLDTSTWGGKTAGPVARDMILAWQTAADKKDK
ncbi:MAG: penicillin-binding transpeptidase domain-containing protein [Verrucomicrobia bacterium]|nr:penicillin-binding transpeptidase domain-containing protein [Verrucomicrobiota bacterium]